MNSFHCSATLAACAAGNEWELALELIDTDVNEIRRPVVIYFGAKTLEAKVFVSTSELQHVSLIYSTAYLINPSLFDQRRRDTEDLKPEDLAVVVREHVRTRPRQTLPIPCEI